MSQRTWARAFAPATVGNVICGFDVFGLALERPGDEVVARLRDEPGVVVTRVTGDDNRIPLQADRNTAGVAAQVLLARISSRQGIALEVHKGLPLSGGLGGSAASAVAAVIAVDCLLDAGVARETLLHCAAAGERIGAGAAHLDNAAPALYGGLVLVRPGDPPDLVQLPVPDGMACAVVHPHIEIETRNARRILGDSVPLANAVIQWSNTAALVAGLFRQDWDLISRALVDVVAEPLRSPLVPGFQAVKDAALHAGALGCGLSGSGPSMFALCRNLEIAERVGAAMQKAFADAGSLPSEAYVSIVNRRGAKVREIGGW